MLGINRSQSTGMRDEKKRVKKGPKFSNLIFRLDYYSLTEIRQCFPMCMARTSNPSTKTLEDGASSVSVLESYKVHRHIQGSEKSCNREDH